VFYSHAAPRSARGLFFSGGFVGDTARAIGQGTFIEFEGKRYELCPWNLNIQGAYEDYLEDCVWAKADRRAMQMPSDQADRFLAATNVEMAMGVCSFGGKYCQQSFQNPIHMKHLLYLMLLEKDNKLTIDVVNRMYEGELRKAIQQKMDRVMSDPFTDPAPTEQPGSASSK
jgi:hypothetical protein